MAREGFPDPIAVVVAERTPRAFWGALRRAARSARLVELRLDALGSVAAVAELLERLARSRLRAACLATCRHLREGGGFRGSPSAQVAVLALAARAGCGWVDVDARSLETFPRGLRRAVLPRLNRIVSWHDFRGTPRQLEAVYRRLARLAGPGDKVKLAVTARRQRDNLAVLDLARRHRGKVITLAMGTAGIPSRVLGVRSGSALAYAAPDSGPGTAPGQLGAGELRHLYRAPRLNARTRVYGVIGRPIAHSLSPPLHNAAFAARRQNAVYLPFEVADLGDFLACVQPLGIGGFSVTAPHKQAILRHLDGADRLAEMIGAVNTVVVRGVSRGRARLYGYNTDYVGILRTLQRSIRLPASRVLVVGAGGSARAVAFALATAGAFVCVTARRPAAAQKLAGAVGGEALPRGRLRGEEFDAIINCTPVGQAPNVGESPLEARELNCRVVVDLVYNPRQTELLRLGRRRRIQVVPGWQMLVEQGAAQYEIWTGMRAPLRVMRRAVRERLPA